MKRNSGCEFIIKLPIERLQDDENNRDKCLNIRSKVEVLEVEFSDIYL